MPVSETTTKLCDSCQESKAIEQFYVNRSSRGGRDNYCKVCRIAYVSRYQKSDAGRAKRAAWVKTEAGREWERRHSVAQKARFPEKVRVRSITNRAIFRGVLVRPDKCSACSVACSPDAHHDDYSKPLDVRWLCVSCHHKHHEKEAES